MSSLKQIEANRRNALKSTGPTTMEGKERSRRNALRHGLTSETVIAGLEDAEDYQAFEAVVIADYNAETAVERELVLRLASALWRLRRATEIETALFETIIAEACNHEQVRKFLVEAADSSTVAQLYLDRNQQTDADPAELCLDRKKRFGDVFSRLNALPTYPLDRLSRYEYVLWRQTQQIVFTLQSIQRRKRHRNRSSFPFSFRRASFEKPEG
jgi:hypothetical protein